MNYIFNFSVLFISFCNCLFSYEKIGCSGASKAQENKENAEPKLIAQFQTQKVIKDDVYNFYSIILQNFNINPNEKFMLCTRNCVGELNEIGEVFQNVKGENIILFPNKKYSLLKTYLFFVGGMCLGESMDIILTNKDNSKCISTHLVNHPIEATNGSGQKISIELRSLDGSLYECIGEGFNPKEEIKIESFSNESPVILTFINANEQGRFSFFVIPNNERNCDGLGFITSTRQSGDALTVKYYWGKKYIKRVKASSMKALLENNPNNHDMFHY